MILGDTTSHAYCTATSPLNHVRPCAFYRYPPADRAGYFLPQLSDALGHMPAKITMLSHPHGRLLGHDGQFSDLHCSHFRY
ncbi:hypothetical protein C8Q70DRAFT_986696 [Cubamyces menziesii]|nr:hypothetical protein C8Q70DRAFT_986696 [Cubamyces menziesii]